MKLTRNDSTHDRTQHELTIVHLHVGLLTSPRKPVFCLFVFLLFLLPLENHEDYIAFQLKLHKAKL